MTEEKYTRCPGCKTVFRVTDAQLALRDGMVRCGHCQTIFDGRAAQISLAPVARSDDDLLDESLLGPPTVTLRSSRALEAAPDERPSRMDQPSQMDRSSQTDRSSQMDRPSRLDRPSQIEPRLHDEPDARDSVARDSGADTRPGDDGVDYENRFAWDKPRPRKLRHAWLYALAIPLLVVLLAGQLLYHFRDAIPAHWPATKPALTAMCATLGCSVRPLRDVGALSIDASDLQVDPAHKGLLILTATVRNRAAYALAYPHLELTLTDAQDQIVVRRAFAPAEYLSGSVDIEAGLAGNGEVALKLFIDASATTQAGYRLYL